MRLTRCWASFASYDRSFMGLWMLGGSTMCSDAGRSSCPSSKRGAKGPRFAETRSGDASEGPAKASGQIFRSKRSPRPSVPPNQAPEELSGALRLHGASESPRNHPKSAFNTCLEPRLASSRLHNVKILGANGRQVLHLRAGPLRHGLRVLSRL